MLFQYSPSIRADENTKPGQVQCWNTFKLNFDPALLKQQKQKSQNLPGCNKFNYKLQVRGFQQSSAVEKECCPNQISPIFSLTDVPMDLSLELEPKWKLV